jgi:hypothetical protein
MMSGILVPRTVLTLYHSRLADKPLVNRFTEHALQILEAAESASAHGEACSEMTIVVGREGAITMLADSDWPLDSLASLHGARAVYRVKERSGTVSVEGREGSRTCLMESRTPAAIARQLLGSPAGRSFQPQKWLEG